MLDHFKIKLSILIGYHNCVFYALNYLIRQLKGILNQTFICRCIDVIFIFLAKVTPRL